MRLGTDGNDDGIRTFFAVIHLLLLSLTCSNGFLGSGKDAAIAD